VGGTGDGEAVGGKATAAVVRTRLAWAAPLFGPCGWWVVSTRFRIFLNKPAQTWKLKLDALPCSKNDQFLHVARLGYYEQFYKLFQHPILKRIRVKNPRTESTFESLMNFKRDLNLLEKSGKFPKILSWHDLHKSEFSWDRLHARMWVTIHMPYGGVWNKIKEFEFEVQTVQPFMYNPILEGFHLCFRNTQWVTVQAL
jgi:hypothetical protein